MQWEVKAPSPLKIALKLDSAPASLGKASSRLLSCGGRGCKQTQEHSSHPKPSRCTALLHYGTCSSLSKSRGVAMLALLGRCTA